MSRDTEWVMARKNRYHGLSFLKNACREAGDPQRDLRIVHITGTNGKGSTVNYLRDILMSEGYRVGTFTSPHLQDHRDRIRLNGEWIPEETFSSLLKEYMPLIEKYDLGMFEIDCLLCFVWMKQMKADWLLLEAGLGGRLDNTNIIDKSALSVITNTGMDHMQILGSRKAQIAFEKAGIIKPDGKVISGENDPVCRSVIRAHAARIRAGASFLNAYRPAGTHVFRFQDERYEVQGAAYQKANAALALYAAQMLGVNIKKDSVKEAVRTSFWPARFERVRANVILDGAHNTDGIRALCSSLQGLPRPLTVVFSALKDKQVSEMAAMLDKNCDHLIMTYFENTRSEKGHADSGYTYIEDMREAVKRGIEEAGNTGTCVITGSLYFISIIREMFFEKT
ncbi:MAG: bifunctional folylpolyglutamate synthase/dihydrofolate synthase [Solobacterium sp.]|nr:bifunctional folylpolyglutamate synthase/dihydrofolate synthase [Solobacterium sp.]